MTNFLETDSEGECLDELFIDLSLKLFHCFSSLMHILCKDFIWGWFSVRIAFISLYYFKKSKMNQSKQNQYYSYSNTRFCSGVIVSF